MVVLTQQATERLNPQLPQSTYQGIEGWGLLSSKIKFFRPKISSKRNDADCGLGIVLFLFSGFFLLHFAFISRNTKKSDRTEEEN